MAVMRTRTFKVAMIAVATFLVCMAAAWADRRPQPEDPAPASTVWKVRPVHTPPEATEGAPAWAHTCTGSPEDFNCPTPSPTGSN